MALAGAPQDPAAVASTIGDGSGPQRKADRAGPREGPSPPLIALVLARGGHRELRPGAPEPGEVAHGPPPLCVLAAPGMAAASGRRGGRWGRLLLPCGAAAVVSIILMVPSIVLLFIAERYLKTEYLSSAFGKL